jgi:TrmH family RNA methyltransferase
VLLDGVHLVEAAAASGVPIEVAAVTEAAVRRDDRLAGLLETLERRGTRVVRVTGPVMDALSPSRTPSGVVAIAQPIRAPLESAFQPPPALVVILADVQDPGNVGAVIRVTDAAGGTGVLAAGASADPWGWKAMRGAMGSTFRVPVAARPRPDEVFAEARRRGVRVLAAVPRDAPSLYGLDLRGPVALLLGREGAGLDPTLVAAADGCLSIPMRDGVESLNVAVASGLMLYEARRQRHHA